VAAAHAFELEGGDAHQFEMTAPPAFASDEMAAEMVIQRGALAPRITVIDPVRRHIRNGRDLTEYVHLGQSYQAFLDACVILLVRGAPFKRRSGTSTFGGPACPRLPRPGCERRAEGGPCGDRGRLHHRAEGVLRRDLRDRRSRARQRRRRSAVRRRDDQAPDGFTRPAIAIRGLGTFSTLGLTGLWAHALAISNSS
jgi:hypothetical protein